MDTTINTTKATSPSVKNATSSSKITKEKAIKTLKSLVTAREAWEKGAFKTSNEMLYGTLQRCYGYYNQMCVDDDEGKAARDGLDAYIAEKGYLFSKSAHNITKIVKCVFGADRRRVSAYSIALRRAHSEGVLAIDIATFISNNGGVEELRLPKSAALTPKQKAEIAVTTIKNENLGTFKTEELTKELDASNIGKQFVLIVSQGADAKLTVNALVYSQAAIDAALASYYSSTKASQSDAKKAQASSQPQSAAADAVEAAVEKLAA